MQMVDETLYDAFGAREIGAIYTASNQYRIILEVQPEFQQDAAALAMIYVPGSNGAQVPLSAFIRMEPKAEPLVVNHLSEFPSVTLSFNLAPGTSLGEALDRIGQMTDALRLPPGVRSSFQGTAQAFQSSMTTMPLLILAAIIVVYIVLGMLYESYVHPLTILSSLPSAGVGALLILPLLGYDLDIMAIIGIVLLIGIVKKNAIMMVDFALEGQRREGRSPLDAIHQACLLRFRPIMMTTMSALLGSLPLAVGMGAGSELRRPLGIAIVGGLLVSQSLTLFTVPVIYLYLERLSQWLRGHSKGAVSEVRNRSGAADGRLTAAWLQLAASGGAVRRNDIMRVPMLAFPHSTVPHPVVLHPVVLHPVVLHRVVLHPVVLHRVVLHRVVLHPVFLSLVRQHVRFFVARDLSASFLFR